uniref:thrombomodulin-like n=1 Tax=Scatophagus argus TaxID=75038 RepID=UPI001ED809B3|nr:thrombomodulin-like [Scatophagus argus]
MMPTTNALIVCVIFLCGLEEAVVSQHGRCTGNQCFALFQEPENFLGAQKRCKGLDGKLLTFNSPDTRTIMTILPIGLSGSYWLELSSTDRPREEAAAGLQNCSSISVSIERNFTVTWKPCRENLDGFLCNYTFTEPCGVLKAGGGAQVKYTVPMGFEANDTEAFPPGTIAVAQRTGVKYPDSKHLCFSKGWIRAPWNCEVLQGGCEYSCNSTCHCPARQTLHPNNITCSKDPCAECAQECQREGDIYVCKCNRGYRLAQDGRSCVDVNECEEDNPCTGEGEECKNTQGDFECGCEDGFEAEDGVCVNIAICESCEHMLCDKFNGVYKCMCREGFKVSDKDPTKCELDCRERDCKAICIPNRDNDKKDMDQCYCPEGYIIDMTNSTAICIDINECELEKQCDHECENSFGGYRCLCNKGFKLHKGYKCVPTEEEEEEEEEDGSGSTPPYPTTVSTHPAAVPPYIKTGSVLGITMFTVLCVALLFFVVRNVAKRCRTFEFSSLKHQNIDIFYLQQVTTETYKRLSFDKPSKNDSQIL